MTVLRPSRLSSPADWQTSAALPRELIAHPITGCIAETRVMVSWWDVFEAAAAARATAPAMETLAGGCRRGLMKLSPNE